MDNTFGLRLVGVDAPWKAAMRGDPDAAALDAVRRIADGDAAEHGIPAPSGLAVLASPTGDEYVVLPGAAGPQLVPWVAGSPLEGDGGEGYTALMDLANVRPRVPGAHEPSYVPSFFGRNLRELHVSFDRRAQA